MGVWESHISMKISKDSEVNKVDLSFWSQEKGGKWLGFQRGNGQFTGGPESGKHILSRQLKQWDRGESSEQIFAWIFPVYRYLMHMCQSEYAKGFMLRFSS